MSSDEDENMDTTQATANDDEEPQDEQPEPCTGEMDSMPDEDEDEEERDQDDGDEDNGGEIITNEGWFSLFQPNQHLADNIFGFTINLSAFISSIYCQFKAEAAVLVINRRRTKGRARRTKKARNPAHLENNCLIHMLIAVMNFAKCLD
jgi:hypothetical protein